MLVLFAQGVSVQGIYVLSVLGVNVQGVYVPGGKCLGVCVLRVSVQGVHVLEPYIYIYIYIYIYVCVCVLTSYGIRYIKLAFGCY